MTEEEHFRKYYPDFCYGDRLLSPYWDLFQYGVEFGERQSEKKIEELEKANEWHYVKDEDFPTEITEKKYLVALKSEYSGFFFETDIWCKSLHCFASNNPTKVYAWKEIVLPKESE